MVVQRSSLYAAFGAAYLVLIAPTPVHVTAQQQRYVSPARASSSSDLAAGKMVDSIFDPQAPDTLLGNQSRRTVPTTKAVRRTTLQGKLVRNSNPKDGAPPYALVDSYGGILRYVEPVDRINLKPYVGKMVGVRHDTGDILLASQLALPRMQPGTTTRANTSAVQQAAFTEPLPAGQEVLEPTPADGTESSAPVETYTFEGGEQTGDPVYLGETGPVYEDTGIGYGNCPECATGTCALHGGYGRRRASIGPRAYLHGEYLLWWFDGMDTPPLVTTSNAADGGVLPNPGQNDNPTTIILYGDNPLLEDPRSGFRIELGVWLDDDHKQAIEGDYLFLGKLEETFSASGQDGNPIISRPFFDFFPVSGGPPQENAEEVSSDRLDGTVTVYSSSEFQGAGIRFRHNLCRSCWGDPGCGSCVDCGLGVDPCAGPIGRGSICGAGGSEQRYIDFLVGLRWYQLSERLRINEDLVVDAGDATPPDATNDGTQILVMDQFDTENNFIGGELGYDWGISRYRWSANLLTKVALGNTRQKVAISGFTQTIPPDVDPAPAAEEGGLLTQSSNIGQYERDRFSMIPEVNFTLGYQLTQNLKFRIGYTVMYWTNVVRPGDQIDREINSTLLPGTDPEDVEPIPLRPLFTFNDTNLLIQGLNIGGEYVW